MEIKFFSDDLLFNGKAYVTGKFTVDWNERPDIIELDGIEYVRMSCGDGCTPAVCYRPASKRVVV